MADYTQALRLHLANGPIKAKQLADLIGISQPTVSRALSQLNHELVRVGAAASIQYCLRDPSRGFDDIPVYRVDSDGKISELGTLIPVRPQGFVMQQSDGITSHFDSLPWWLYDMRPQGFLGRAYAVRHAAALGLPEKLSDWTDTHSLRALLAHGQDVAGNLLLGEVARAHFINATTLAPIAQTDRPQHFLRLAEEAARGDTPGSSAGGEQPKFTAYVQTAQDPQHVLVKFSLPAQNPVTQRWADLLLAEHLALETLLQAGMSASASEIIDTDTQRFLQVQRFDRIGEHGRRALFSLAALDAEFVGKANASWPVITQQLAAQKVITAEAAHGAQLLYAFGKLIGNTDMHNGNVSFMSEHGRPYELAPAYDMLPMAFAPTTGGQLPQSFTTAEISGEIGAPTWKQALSLAQAYLQQLGQHHGFSVEFAPCMETLRNAIFEAGLRIGKLA
ncbi:type II toxin-antitoxin system HipA family toxin YjjJ [Methylophilus sp. 3sh_L]|uniref:type II toxin-antitoxin system HipA family toxin YjjJ n=1 Tax=Methylophilus sp. 3sh_L TaxID=3377114 RepID=UPI00398F3A6F